MMGYNEQIRISEYAKLYDILIPQDHLFRKMIDLVNFSFIYEELEKEYCLGMGRISEDPVRLFKYLFLKTMYELSDADLRERSYFDMSFKFFLGYNPEDDVIHASTLTKFRRLRLRDEETLNRILTKSVKLAVELGVISSRTIIVDSTHTQAKFKHLNPVEALRDAARKLRRSVYEVDESMKERMPEKTDGMDLEEELAYCKKLIAVIESQEKLPAFKRVKERMNYLQEMVEDNMEDYPQSKDDDARIGHKTADTSFYGYKNHLAMTPEGIVTAITVTSGEKVDGPELKALVEQTKKNGVAVEVVVGDSAYSGKENLEYCEENEMKLVSKLHPFVSQGTRKEEEKFAFNKDAGMFVCRAGHMAIRKSRRHNKQEHRKENPRMVYYFDIEKCKSCPYREGCYKEGAKSKSYSVSIPAEVHSKQKEYQESEEFKSYYQERYRIEQKNADLKNNHGLRKAESSGIHAMKIQGITALFFNNIRLIIKITEEKQGEE